MSDQNLTPSGAEVEKAGVAAQRVPFHPPPPRAFTEIVEKVRWQFDVAALAIQIQHSIRLRRGLVGRVGLSPPQRESALRFSERPVQFLASLAAGLKAEPVG